MRRPRVSFYFCSWPGECDVNPRCASCIKVKRATKSGKTAQALPLKGLTGKQWRRGEKLSLFLRGECRMTARWSSRRICRDKEEHSSRGFWIFRCSALWKNVPPCLCRSFVNYSEPSPNVLPSRKEIVSHRAAIAFQSEPQWAVLPLSVAILTLMHDAHLWIDVTLTRSRTKIETHPRATRRQFSSFDLGQSFNIWNLIIVLARFEFQTAGKLWKLEWLESTRICHSNHFKTSVLEQSIFLSKTTRKTDCLINPTITHYLLSISHFSKECDIIWAHFREVWGLRKNAFGAIFAVISPLSLWVPAVEDWLKAFPSYHTGYCPYNGLTVAKVRALC